MNQNVQQLHELLKRSSHIVFFGGAGVSTASNIPDFRSDEGLYSGKEQKKYPYPPETMLSHTFFVRHTEQFFEYYFDKMVYPDAKPNPAHIALAKLEEMGRLSAVITQNIDGLHQQAGSKRERSARQHHSKGLGRTRMVRAAFQFPQRGQNRRVP